MAELTPRGATVMASSLRHSPVALLVFFGMLSAARVAWGPVLGAWSQLSAWQYAGTGLGLFALGGVLTLAVRSGALARSGSRAVARLPRASLPPEVRRLARRAGVRRVTGLDGADCTAFCAGLLRPTVYVTSGAVRALNPHELEAVLVHEAAHARRRDPLRRLLLRAACDVWPYLPVLRWWARQRMERAELIADRAALARTNAKAVAGALWTAAGWGPLPSGTGSWSGPGTLQYGAEAGAADGAVRARLAQLSGDPRPDPRPAVFTVAASVAGLLGMIVLTIFLGPGVFARA